MAASSSSRVAGPVGGQDRVAAGDQPLAGEVRRGDLGHVLLIEQGQLERAVAGHQLADGGGAQRGDPPVGVRPRRPVFELVQGGDPGAGDHAAVAGHDHFLQAELLPHHVCDGGESARVAGVAGEHPDRDRAALRVGQQPVLDLQFPFLAVPGVPAGRQRAVPSFHPRAGQVEQRLPRRVGRGAQVPGRQPGLDAVLLAGQPVHRRVDVIGAGPVHAQVGAQGGVGPPGQGGQLGAGPDHPGDDQGHRQVPARPGRAEQGGQPQLGGHRVHGGGVPVRQRPGDRHRLAGRDQLLALQPGVDQVDHVVRQRGQVGHGLVLDLAAIAVGAAQVRRGVVLAAALLVDVPGLGDSDYVDFPASSSHNQIIATRPRAAREDTPNILTTLCAQKLPKPQFRVQRLRRATATSA